MKGFSYTEFFYRSSLYFALAVALTATLGSLYFSEVRHYLPCNLCWYQRILMYPLVVVLAVGLLRQDINLPYYVLPLTLFGQAIATYHYLLEKTNIFAAPTACHEGIPCTTPWINWGGFITIPFLAMSAFFLITILALIAMTAGEPTADEYASAPWLQVGAIVALVIVAFVLIYQYDPLRADTLALTVPVVGEMTPVNATATPSIQPSLATTNTSITNISTTSTPPQTQTDATGIVQGQELYVANCAVCHGTDAQGIATLGTSLVESAIIHEQSQTEALAFIREGRPAEHPDNTTGVVMPPSGGNPNLSDADILAIVTFLQAQ